MAEQNTTIRKKDRIEAAFMHREPDRVPMFEQIIASDVASEIIGREVTTGTSYVGYQTAVASMKGDDAFKEFRDRIEDDHLAIVRALDLDMLYEPPHPSERPTRQLDEYTFLYGDPEGDHYINRLDPPSGTFCCIKSVSSSKAKIEDPDDLVPLVEETEKNAEAWSAEDLHAAFPWKSRALKKFGHEYEIAGGSHLSIGLDQVWLMACVLRPDLVARRLDAQVKVAMKVLEAHARLGIRVIFGGGDLGDKNGPVYGPRVFHDLVLPRLKQVTQKCRELGLWYIFRSDGNLKSILDDMFVEGGVHGYGEIDHGAGMYLDDLKPRYGDHVTFWGNMPCGTVLMNGTPEEVSDLTKKMIDVAAPGGGYIFGSSVCIMPRTPAKNVMAMYETAREYGKY